jgi:xylan 1,4-beta-xylosidase
MDTGYDLLQKNVSVPMLFVIRQVREMDVHWNDELELIIVLNGILVNTSNNQQSIAREDDVLVVNENTLHGMYAENGAVIAMLTINTGLLEGYDRRLRFECDSTKDSNQGRYYPIKHLVANLVKENAATFGPGQDVTYYNKAFIFFLLDELSRKFRVSNSEKYAPKYIKRLTAITSYIHEHYREILSLQKVADVVYLSVPYLSSFFEKYMGTSFLAYYNSVRFNHAYNELITTENSIETIAMGNGFSDTRTFVNLFKKKYNSLPSEYRKNLADKNRNGLSIVVPQSEVEIGEANYLKILAKYLRPLGNIIPDKNMEITNTKIINVKDINVTKPIRKLRHTWRIFTSVGRAKELLYGDIQEMLRILQKEIGFVYIKFHGILSDDMMVYREDEEGNALYSFILIDKALDFLLSIGLKPLIQLSFMPSDLASDPGKTIFSSPFNTSPPKDISKWQQLIHALMQHLVEKYGISTIRSWLFCVWNEPETFENLFGFKKAETFYELYKTTYDTVKSIDRKLRFGSPSMFFSRTSRSWCEAFIKWCGENKRLPDFINLHYYDNDYSDDALKQMRPPFIHTHNRLNRDENAFSKAVTDTKDYFLALGIADLPVFMTEWNLTVSHRNLINDTCFKSCYLIKNILENYDNLDSFGYWTLTDFIEETQLAKECFHGGQGIFTYNGIKKPPFYAFSFLRCLGNELLSQGPGYCVTKSSDAISVILYNYEHFNHLFATGETFDMSFTERYTPFSMLGWASITLCLVNMPNGLYIVRESFINQENGSAFDIWVKSGVDYGGAQFVDDRDVEWLKSTSVPGLRACVETVDNNQLALEAMLSPLEVRLIEIKRMP